MGRVCIVCESLRPNEAFSGRGRRRNVCLRCSRLPRAEQSAWVLTHTLFNYLAQKNISAKNLLHLQQSQPAGTGFLPQLHQLVLDIARAHPRREERWKWLAQHRPALVARALLLLGEDFLLETCGLDAGSNASIHSLLDSLRDTAPPPAPSLPPPAAPSQCPPPPQSLNDLKTVTIYSDGACRGNPGPGGWAAILVRGKHRKELTGGHPDTTNNRMEMSAALAALGALKQKCQVQFFTDSEYLRNGITKWLGLWKRRGWITKSNQPVKNADLWRQLDEVASNHHVDWCWVKGHSGHKENERCDQLAKRAAREHSHPSPAARRPAGTPHPLPARP